MRNITRRSFCYTLAGLGFVGPLAGTSFAAKEKLVAVANRLDFRIVANVVDDQAGQAAAKKFFAQAVADAERKQELEKCAKAGLPPPSPPAEKDAGFASKLGKFTYAWVELAPSLIRSWQLDPSVKTDAQGLKFRKQAADARAKGQAVLTPAGFLLYSRPCQNAKHSVQERKKKGIEFFLLMRDPEKNQAITHQHLLKAGKGIDDRKQPGIHLELTKEGGKRLFVLTTKNKPTPGKPEFRRQLALMVNDQAVWLGKILDPIRDKALISGKFSAEEISDFIKVFQSGKTS